MKIKNLGSMNFVNPFTIFCTIKWKKFLYEELQKIVYQVNDDFPVSL